MCIYTKFIENTCTSKSSAPQKILSIRNKSDALPLGCKLIKLWGADACQPCTNIMHRIYMIARRRQQDTQFIFRLIRFVCWSGVIKNVFLRTTFRQLLNLLSCNKLGIWLMGVGRPNNLRLNKRHWQTVVLLDRRGIWWWSSPVFRWMGVPVHCYCY